MARELQLTEGSRAAVRQFSKGQPGQELLPGPPVRPGADSAGVRGRQSADAQVRHGPDRIAWAIARIGRSVGFEGYHFVAARHEHAGDGNGPAQMRSDQGAYGKPGTGRGRGPLEAVNGRAGRQGVAAWFPGHEHSEAGNTGGR